MKSRQIRRWLRNLESHIAQSLHQSYKEQFTSRLYYTVYKISRYKCLQKLSTLFCTKLLDTDEDAVDRNTLQYYYLNINNSNNILRMNWALQILFTNARNE
jgi:hypothetical protein